MCEGLLLVAVRLMAPPGKTLVSGCVHLTNVFSHDWLRLSKSSESQVNNLRRGDVLLGEQVRT